MHLACLDGHLDVAKYLTEEQHCDPACKNSSSWILIHAAYQNGHLDVARYLAEEQHCDPACKNRTPIHAARPSTLLKNSTVILLDEQGQLDSNSFYM